MADQATRQLRVWRGDAAGGGLTDYTVPDVCHVIRDHATTTSLPTLRSWRGHEDRPPAG